MQLQPLAMHYLELMQVSDQTEVYLIDDRRVLLFSRSASVLSDTIKERLNAGKEDILQIGEDLVAYSPILLQSHQWTIVTVSPARAVSDIAIPIYRQIAFVLFIFLAIVMFVVVSIWSKRKAVPK